MGKSLDVILAQIGVNALIDEATGYQYIRAKDELYNIFKDKIDNDLIKWQVKFPYEFYNQFLKLYGFDNLYQNMECLYRFTNRYIYKPLSKEILSDLKRSIPKEIDKETMFLIKSGYVTQKVGHNDLDKHLTRILVIMKLSKDIAEFKRNYKKLFGGKEVGI